MVQFTFKITLSNWKSDLIRMTFTMFIWYYIIYISTLFKQVLMSLHSCLLCIHFKGSTRLLALPPVSIKTVISMTESVQSCSVYCVIFPPQVFSDDRSYWYQYQLDVKGFVGANQVFSNSTMMVFNPKCMSVFIQTDKNNYQPGQTVKFRVVLVTPEGNPYKGQIDIFIRVGVCSVWQLSDKSKIPLVVLNSL